MSDPIHEKLVQEYLDIQKEMELESPVLFPDMIIEESHPEFNHDEETYRKRLLDPESLKTLDKRIADAFSELTET